MMRIEVVSAQPETHRCVVLWLPAGATVADAVRAAGLGADYAALAVFGTRVAPGTTLRDGDRVELLRALATDPREARRQRARRSRSRR